MRSIPIEDMKASSNASMAAPNRRTIWIHIGAHKTGTTSLQVAVARERDLLLRHGLFVPRAGMTDTHAGHHNIAWELRSDPRFRPAQGGIGDLIAELSGIDEHQALISSEDFEYLVAYPKRLAAFETALRRRGWEPAYIVHFRDQAGYAVSLYHELRKHGLTGDFSSFAAQILLRGRFVMKDDWLFSFDYARFLDRWSRAASGRIRTFTYRRDRPASRLIRDMLTLVGVDTTVAAVVAERAAMLNVSNARRSGPKLRLAKTLFPPRFALSNARLRRAWGVDLSRRQLGA
jgi:hypothetical protein